MYMDGSSGSAVVSSRTVQEQYIHVVGLDKEEAIQLHTTMKPNDELCSLHTEPSDKSLL